MPSNQRRNWTKEEVHLEALKYSTRTEFKTNSPKAYSRACVWKIIDEVCSHMRFVQLSWTDAEIIRLTKEIKTKKEFRQNGKLYAAARRRGLVFLNEVSKHMISFRKDWSDKKIRQEARKYTRKVDFMRHSPGAYNRALKRGILDEVCSHIKPIRNNWTKKKLREIAKSCSTRSEFKSNNNGAYIKSLRFGRDFMNDICSHMELQGTRQRRMIYLLKFPKIKAVYIGLTYNFEKRKREHLVKSSNKDVRKLLKVHETYEWEAIPGFFDIKNAEQVELSWVEKYKKEDWNVLNIATPGAIGAGYEHCTDEEIILEAKKYTIKKDYRENSPYYSMACFRGPAFYKKVMAHMKSAKKEYTKEELRKEARKYNLRQDFYRYSGLHHSAARRLGREFFNEICSHMPPQKVRWSKEAIIAEAKKHPYRSDFSKYSGGAYSAAKAYGANFFKKVTSHMPEKKLKWTKDNLLAEALKYKTRTEFIRKSSGAVEAAKRIGIEYYDEITLHMKGKSKRILT